MTALDWPDADVLPGTAALPLAGEGAKAINDDGKRRRPAALHAVAAAAGARAGAEMFHKGLASTLWTAKRHIDPARWRAFMDDLRRECEPFAPRDTPSRGRR